MASIKNESFFIEAKINDTESRCVWWLVEVYASATENVKKEQWKILEQKKREGETLNYGWGF